MLMNFKWKLHKEHKVAESDDASENPNGMGGMRMRMRMRKHDHDHGLQRSKNEVELS